MGTEKPMVVNTEVPIHQCAPRTSRLRIQIMAAMGATVSSTTARTTRRVSRSSRTWSIVIPVHGCAFL